MATTTSIEWTEKTWNPIRGCSVVSPGCVNCYAMKQAHRFSGMKRVGDGPLGAQLVPGPFHGLTKQTTAGPQWTGKVVTVEDALLEPLRWKKPQRVFVNSMSDLFHEDVPDAFIDKVFAVMALAPRHTFQILTKRADRMRAYVSRLDRDLRLPSTTHPRWRSDAETILQERGDVTTTVTSDWPLPNVWFGVSVEDQPRYDERIGKLLRTPAAVRFLSIEPQLGPIDLRMGGMSMPDYSAHEPLHVDWIIVGGESGPGARPFDISWARSIVQQCKAAGVPVFVKQLGANAHSVHVTDREGRYIGGALQPGIHNRKGGDPDEWPADLRVRQFPEVRA